MMENEWLENDSFDGVQLLHAADTLKTVKCKDNCFNPSKMFKQPIRVAQPPPNSQSQKQSLNLTPSSRYEELLRTAERQRQLIDINRRTIRERELRDTRKDHAQIRLSTLRKQVLYEEREMMRLKAIENNAKKAAACRISAEQRLCDLRTNFSSQEQHLRTVVTKIASLQAQLEILYRRRLVALKAAQNQQRLFGAQKKAANISDSSIIQQLIARPEGIRTSKSWEMRPQSVELSAGVDKSSIASKNDASLWAVNRDCFGHSAVLKYTNPPGTSDNSNQVSRRKPIVDFTSEMSKLYQEQQPEVSGEIASDAKKPVMKRNLILSDRPSREMSPSPPKDPYPTNFENCEDGSSATNSTVTDGKNDENFEKSAEQQKANGSSCCEIAIKNEINDLDPIIDNQNDISDIKLLDVDSTDDVRLAPADQVSIRPDNLRAAKRRSWALQEAVFDETEYIKKILRDEQKKGRTHLVLGRDIEHLLNTSSVNREQKEEPKRLEREQQATSFENCVAAIDEVILDPCELLEIEPKICSEEPSESAEGTEASNEFNLVIENESYDKSISIIGSSGNESSSSNSQLRPLPKKSILRTGDVRKPPKRVIFDPLALLLDAALEGELEFVKENAAKISDISTCNDEGITALHNAICAGNYEIVQFLVESFADVNAQDSDGWTPLHCAASCNNLPMIKLLVESGACIFAQTLSDFETPEDKCEVDEDGFEGCRLYLERVSECSGLINDRYVYAVHSFNAEREDELSVEIGDAMWVIEKDVNDMGWWLCDKKTDSEADDRGLVPRNYLALYPLIGKRSDDFIMFDLPPLEELPQIGDKNIDIQHKSTTIAADGDHERSEVALPVL